MAIKIKKSTNSTPVNSVKLFNDGEELRENGGIWLRSGILETDTTKYPEAHASIAYSGESIGRFSGDSSSIIYDESTSEYIVLTEERTNYFNGGPYTDINILRYNASGGYLGAIDSYNYPPFNQENTYYYNSGIVYIPTTSSYWISVYNSTTGDNVIEYVLNGDFSVGNGFRFNEDDIRDIDGDETNFWILGASSPTIYKVSQTGNLLETITLENIENVYKMCKDGSFFWVLNGGEIFQYDDTGAYTGTKFSVNPQTSPKDLFIKSNYIVVLGTDNAIYKYDKNKKIGIGEISYQGKFNYYVRVK